MIYCFDLDNCLCSTTESNEYGRAKPFKDRIAKVNRLYAEGHTIIIDTARGSQSKKDLKSLTAGQLKRWGVNYHQLRCGIKLFAHCYVDDRAINDKDFFK